MCLLTFNEVAKPGLVANQDDRARKVVFWWAALKCGSRSPLAAKLQRRQTHKQLVWKVQQEQLFVATHWVGGWVQPDRRCCNCSVCNNEEQEPGEGPRDCGSTGSNTFFPTWRSRGSSLAKLYSSAFHTPGPCLTVNTMLVSRLEDVFCCCKGYTSKLLFTWGLPICKNLSRVLLKKMRPKIRYWLQIGAFKTCSIHDKFLDYNFKTLIWLDEADYWQKD